MLLALETKHGSRAEIGARSGDSVSVAGGIGVAGDICGVHGRGIGFHPSTVRTERPGLNSSPLIGFPYIN
jgi:hypothetical protein